MYIIVANIYKQFQKKQNSFQIKDYDYLSFIIAKVNSSLRRVSLTCKAAIILSSHNSYSAVVRRVKPPFLRLVAMVILC